MFPAMDRVSKISANRLKLGLAIALAAALGPSGLGCSKFQSLRRPKSEPALIGQTRETSDIYAGSHGPAPSQAEMAASTTPMPQPMVAAPAPGFVMDEDPEPTIITRPVDDRAPLDAVQPTSTAQPLPNSASTGVPHGARLIASAERGSDPAKVVKEAREALDRMPNYQVSMHRQERVDGRLQPEEDVILAVRREPRAVRLTWAEGDHKGREVLYRADEPGGSMHVNPGGVLPRMTLSPTSPLVMRNSRHPITEAGFESLVVALESELSQPNSGGLTSTGADRSVLVRTTPEGETWRVTIDPATHLPELVECDSSKGELLERYSFRDLKVDLPELATADAFDPNARWGQPRGLFGRLSAPTETPH